MSEEWRAIPSLPGFSASSLGRIRRDADGFIPAPYPKLGYLHVTVGIDGTRRHVRVNRAVCEAWHGAAPAPRYEAAHLNGIRTENNPGNLAWKTHSENMADRDAHGTTARGETHGNAKLTLPEVRAIRASIGRVPVLALTFGVGRPCIHKIRSRKTWRHA